MDGCGVLEKLVPAIIRLKKGPVGLMVRERMEQFRALGSSSDDEVFKELCFCILTANYTAEGGIRIQKAIGNGFITLPREALASRLRSLGYRFPNARADYIIRARVHRPELCKRLSSSEAQDIRHWLVGHVHGLGYKESSHFLRNIGRTGFAIIDFHIIDLLVRYGMIEKPKSKSLSRKRYEEIESVLAKMAKRSGTTQGELDLYLWYMETGKILK
jgi:N-glycosylase/DNA lyase